MPITNIEGVGAALATGSSLQFQFIFEINHFSFGVDGISLFFVLLTTFITPIAIFSSYELYGYSKSNSVTVNVNSHQHSLLEVNINKEDKPSAGQWQGQETIKLKIFLISLLLLESLQICAFVSLDLLLFYIFFESAK
jgi:NADH:ubiquinone oxidoreductase subunit 4 (subunit M)